MEEKLPIAIDDILASVRKKAGIGDDYTHFDPDLIDLINNAFATLYQIGLTDNGKPIHITGHGEKWSDYITDPVYEWVKDYIFLRVRIVFDPPSSSTLLDNLKQARDEYEWRIYTQLELDEE